MSNHKRIQTLTDFILHLQPHNHIPEVKKQIELLQTALQTLKSFSNDQTLLKSTLLVMRQTVDLINKYNIGDTSVTEQEFIKKRLEKEHSTIRNTERVNDEELESSNDPRCDGSIDSSIEVGGGITLKDKGMGGEEAESLNLNYILNETISSNIKNYTEKNLTNIPEDVKVHLSAILQNFRRSRDERKKEQKMDY